MIFHSTNRLFVVVKLIAQSAHDREVMGSIPAPSFLRETFKNLLCVSSLGKGIERWVFKNNISFNFDAWNDWNWHSLGTKKSANRTFSYKCLNVIFCGTIVLDIDVQGNGPTRSHWSLI